MLRKLSENIVEWQIQNDIINDEERTTYQYAYELLLNQVINGLITLLIAIFLQDLICVGLFLLSYAPLRSYSGGYHANTQLGCTIVSTLLIFFSCWFVGNVRSEWILTYYPLMFVISGYFIIRYAPVSNKNKPLDEMEILFYGKKSRKIWGMEVIAALFFYFLEKRLGLIIAVSHIILVIILYLGIMENRKCHVSE